MNKWRELLEHSPVVMADGAMGTMLFKAGLQSSQPPEVWNVEHPERIRAVHRGYLQAGSQIILTNTFGGNRFRLASHGLQDRTAVLNRAGASNACAEVAAAGGTAIVGGDIGPSGAILAPLGTLDHADAVAGFAEQAAALIDGGVDVMWIETMSDLQEVRAAIEAVRRVSADIPIVTTMTFETRGRTMFGVTPEEAAKVLTGFGAEAVGANCGGGPEEILGVIQKMRAAAPDALLVAKSNAGRPQLVDGRPAWAGTPEVMAACAMALRGAGARVVGGCCGSTPEHIKAMAEALAGEKEPM